MTRHKNNDLATSSRFTFGTLPSRSIRNRQKKRLDDPPVDATQTMIWRPHRGSQSVIYVITVDAAQKQRLDDPIEVHNPRAVVTVDAARKQRLYDPIEVHSRIYVDAAQNHDWMTPSRFKIGSLLSRLIWHNKRTTRRPHRRSRPAICDITVDAAQQQQTTRAPLRGSQSARCRHGSSGSKKNNPTTPSTFTIGYLCHNGRSNTKTITRRPIRGSQSAMCATTVDPAQIQ